MSSGYSIVYQQNRPPSSILTFFANFLSPEKNGPFWTPPFWVGVLVLDEWYLPILYSGGPIFRKYLKILFVSYGFGGDSPHQYAKVRRIIIIKIVLKKPDKKKKSREIWWNAPKKSLRAFREKKNFCERNPTLVRKEKITNKVRDLIMDVSDFKNKLTV